MEITVMQSDTAWMAYCYQQHMKDALGLNARTIDARLRHVHRFLEQCECPNLGHEDLGTTLQYYGKIDQGRQQD